MTRSGLQKDLRSRFLSALRYATGRERVIRYRRRFFELLGSGRYSRTGLEDLDRKLARHLPKRGVFVEAGAFDGFHSSNTYYLERVNGWTGVLIEPTPTAYELCVARRPNSRVFNCALVSPDFKDTTVEMFDAHVVSMIKGSQAKDVEAAHLEAISKYVTSSQIRVPARTLASVLDEAKVTTIDFLSLDVEGYELSVLRGLELERYQPRFMLIEFFTDQARRDTEALILSRYKYVAPLTNQDHLYQIR
jgi:FkbM family methyltransferase